MPGATPYVLLFPLAAFMIENSKQEIHKDEHGARDAGMLQRALRALVDAGLDYLPGHPPNALPPEGSCPIIR